MQRASYDVKVGDVISIRFGQKTLTVEVLSVAENVGKDAAAAMYREAGGSAGQTVIMQGVPSYDTVKTVWEGALFQCLTI